MTGDELYHYGRTGMKWYQHIFGDDPRWGRNGRNDKARAAKREAKAVKRAAKLAKKTAKAQAKAAKNANKPLNANQKRRQEALERKRLQAEVNEQVNAAKEAAKKIARNVWVESNGDIQAMRQRLIDQRQLKQLVEEETSPLKAMAKRALKNSGQRAMEQVLNTAVDIAINKLRSDVTSAINSKQKQGGQENQPKLSQEQYQSKVDELIKSINADTVKKKKK